MLVDSVLQNVQIFDPLTDYRSGTRIQVQHYFKKWGERSYVLQVKLVW